MMSIDQHQFSDNLLETLILEGGTIDRAIETLQRSLSSVDPTTSGGQLALAQLVLFNDQLNSIRHNLDDLDRLVIDARDAILEEGMQAQ